MVCRLTDAQLKALKPKPARYEVWEGDGFGVRVSPGGTKSFVLVYHFKGKARRLTLGAYPATSLVAARTAAATAREKLALGIDPGTEQQTARAAEEAAPTVLNMAADFIQKYCWVQQRASTWSEYERILNRYVLPATAGGDRSPWWGRKSKDIRRADVVALLDQIVADGAPIMANRVKATLSKMFNWGISRDYSEANPCAALDRPAPEVACDRHLDYDEIKALWRDLDAAALPKVMKLALKFILVTWQRPGEVLGITEDEVKGDLWTIPGARTKNKKTHLVPLSRLALDILDEARRLPGAGDGFLFPSPKVKGRPLSGSGLAHALADALLAPNAEEQAKGARKCLRVSSFTPHDLRRTGATRATEAGVRRETVKRVLNHLPTDVTKVYDRYEYLVEKRQALEVWERKLREVFEDQPPGANVVALRPAEVG